jgi:hypothetical protein
MVERIREVCGLLERAAKPALPPTSRRHDFMALSAKGDANPPRFITSSHITSQYVSILGPMHYAPPATFLVFLGLD